MLTYALRLSSLLAWHAWVEEPADPTKPFHIRARAWPWLCDAYRHLNNAAYLRLAEDARWAWIARTPLLRRALSHHWSFLVMSADVLYRREIPLMASFEIVSRVIAADERSLYFSQEFVLPNRQIACRVLIRAIIRSKQGIIAPAEVAAVAGITIPEAALDVERIRALADSQLAAVNAGATPV